MRPSGTHRVTPLARSGPMDYPGGSRDQVTPMFPPPRFLLRHPRIERWVSTVFRDYARTFRPQWQVETRFGHRLLINRDCAVGMGMLSRGLWEFRQLEYLEKAVAARIGGRPSAFIDIGAYWGLYAIYANHWHVFDRVIAFEPERASIVHMRANLMLNGLERDIELIEKAVSDRAGEAVLALDGGCPSLVDRPDASAHVTVPTVTLDDELGLSGHFLVIKLDIEGFEATALRGMARTMAENHVLLQIEIFDENRDEVRGVLADLGLTEVHRIGAEYYFETASGSGASPSR